MTKPKPDSSAGKQPPKPERVSTPFPGPRLLVPPTSLGFVPERVATPEKCRDEAARLFDEIETWQGKALAASLAKDIFKRFGDPSGQRRKESKQSLKRYKKILLRNTFELLQIQWGKDLGATAAAKKICKLYPKDFPSAEAIEKMLERFGLGVRKGRGKKRPT
jgi:hypothetical protein